MENMVKHNLYEIIKFEIKTRNKGIYYCEIVEERLQKRSYVDQSEPTYCGKSRDYQQIISIFLF